MNRTFVGYLKQSALLVLGEFPSEGDLDFNSIDHPDLGIALSTIFSVDSRVGQADLYFLKRPLVPLGIHSNSHAGTCSQRGQEQLVRVGARIIAAGIARFVCLKHVRADGYVLDMSRRSRMYEHTSAHSLSLLFGNGAWTHLMNGECPLVGSRSNRKSVIFPIARPLSTSLRAGFRFPALSRYFPVKTDFRFSWNARIPSRYSSEPTVTGGRWLLSL